MRGRVKSTSQPIHPEVEIELEKAPQSEKDQAGEERTVVTPRVRLHELLHRPFDVRSFATTGLFVLAAFYTIYFLRSLLLPIVLALLLSYLLRPIVRILVKARIPGGERSTSNIQLSTFKSESDDSLRSLNVER